MSQVYELKHVVELKDKAGDIVERITEVTLRRLTGADLKAIANAADKGKGDAMLLLVSRCASLPTSTVDQLDAQDVQAIGEIAAGFIGGALPTGDK